MGCEDALDEAEDIGTMEHVELGGILFEDMGEGELLDCTPAVVGRAEGYVSGSGRGGVGTGRVDGDEAVGGGDETRERAQTQVDLEQAGGARAPRC